MKLSIHEILTMGKVTSETGKCALVKLILLFMAEYLTQAYKNM